MGVAFLEQLAGPLGDYFNMDNRIESKTTPRQPGDRRERRRDGSAGQPVQQDPRIAGDPESATLLRIRRCLNASDARAGAGAVAGAAGSSWTGRAVLWALIVVIVVNGVRAPFERFTANQAPPALLPPPLIPDSRCSGSGVRQSVRRRLSEFRRHQSRAARHPAHRISRRRRGRRRFGWNGFGRCRRGRHSIPVHRGRRREQRAGDGELPVGRAPLAAVGADLPGRRPVRRRPACRRCCPPGRRRAASPSPVPTATPTSKTSCARRWKGSSGPTPPATPPS